MALATGVLWGCCESLAFLSAQPDPNYTRRRSTLGIRGACQHEFPLAQEGEKHASLAPY